MSFKRFISGVSAFAAMAVTASIIMPSAFVISMPSALADTVNTDTDTEFSDDFESYGGVLNQSKTLQTLKNRGWYACDHTKLYTNVDTVEPYSTMNYKLANTETVDGSTVLRIITAGGAADATQASYGYGRALPGVAADGKATGVYEIQFDYKPILSGGKTQFYFGLNTADGSAADYTDAQHSIMSGYNQNFYIGNRNYMTLRNDNSPILQGTLDANKTGGLIWYTVKAVVNCDAHYYSAELYNRSTGKLIARRSPISFADDESVGFLKLSALGEDYAAAVYIDNVSMKKTAAVHKIYEDNFDSYTNVSYRASSGVTIGGESEDVGGASYFEGYTPWRALSKSGNYYSFEKDPDGSNAVRLGSANTGATGSSGLVYMPVKDKLVTAATQAARGNLRVSFTVKPDAVAAAGYQVYFIPEYNNTVAKAFEIKKSDNTVYIVKPSGSQVIDGSKWYDVELTFDVINKTVKTKAREHGTTAVLSFSTTISSLKAVKGLLFNATDTTSVVLDDVKIRYIVPTVETTEVKLGDSETGDGVFTTDDKVFARAFTSYITSNGITINKVNVTVPGADEATQTITTPNITLTNNSDVLIGIIIASKNNIEKIRDFDTNQIKITVE